MEFFVFNLLHYFKIFFFANMKKQNKKEEEVFK